MRRIAERALFENCTHGVALVGRDGTFLEVNPAFCKLVGYAEAELKLMRFQDVTHPADLDGDVAMADMVAAGQAQHYGMDKRYLSKLGEVVPIELDVCGVRDSAGRFLCFLAQARRKPPQRPHAVVTSPDFPPDAALVLWVRRYWPRLTAAVAIVLGGLAKALHAWATSTN